MFYPNDHNYVVLLNCLLLFFIYLKLEFLKNISWIEVFNEQLPPNIFNTSAPLYSAWSLRYAVWPYPIYAIIAAE